MNKQIFAELARSKGLTAFYSGRTNTMYISGDPATADAFVKRYTPDKTGNVRNEKGHFIKGGLGFKTAIS